MDKEQRDKAYALAEKIVAENPTRKRKRSCGQLYLQAENGDVFCKKVEGHRGCHSALVEWD